MSKPTHTISGQIIFCDPGNPEFYNNPYPVYDQMRAAGPCFFWQEYDIWCFADHANVNAILRDRRFGRQVPDVNMVENAPDHLKAFYAFEAGSILELEPPDHTRLKRLITKAFVSRQIETLCPKIATLAHQLIDKFKVTDEIELLSEFAEIIPVQIIAQMLGVPAIHCNKLLSWSHDMVAIYQHNRSHEIEKAAVEATKQFSVFIKELMHKRSAVPKDDLISHLLAEQNKGENLSDNELITTCILLLNAGHEATVHALGNSVKSLLENFRDPAALFNSSEKIAAICEETLRFDPPLHKFTRYVLEDLEFGGRNFKRGDIVGLMLGAANRDPKKFSNPNQLNFSRPGLVPANLAFGAGIHFCIGAPLARLEMQIALPILFQRLPNIKLAKTPIYADRYHFRGLENLQISI